jgi:hypothetical protein
VRLQLIGNLLFPRLVSIGGYTAQGSRAELGALPLGYYEGMRLMRLGHEVSVPGGVLARTRCAKFELRPIHHLRFDQPS